MSDICLTTGIECIKCNPGPCEHRGSSINENLNTCPCCDNKVEYHPKSIHMNNFWNKHTIVCPNCGLKMQLCCSKIGIQGNQLNELRDV